MKKTTKFISLDCASTPQDRWLNLWRATYKRGEDRNRTWLYASRRPRPILFNALEGGPQQQKHLVPDAAIIVPGLDVDGETHLVMIKELRIPLGGYEYSFPAGIVDANETVEESAKRELFEETGLQAGPFDQISPVLFSSAGAMDESVQVLFTLATGTPTNANQENTEDIEVLVLSPDRVRELRECRGEFENVYISAKAWPIMWMWEQVLIKDR